MLFIVIVFIVQFALKFYYAGLATKHWLISKGYFLLYAFKWYYKFKHQKEASEVYYEHDAHHDHHLPSAHDVLGYGEHDSDYSTHVTNEHVPYWGAEDHVGYKNSGEHGGYNGKKNLK